VTEVNQDVAGVAVEIGGMPILLRTSDASFREMLERRYRGFIRGSQDVRFTFDIEVRPPDWSTPDDDIEVRAENGRWLLRRGDFRAEWDPQAAHGTIRQATNPFAIDSVLRIVHTLILADEGGFLLHAASAIRNGRAFVFAGVSGAGKTTISRLAPPDVTLLSDEISYVRRADSGYSACGTPFSGELAKSGENTAAPLAALFFLNQGPHNRVDQVEPREAVRRLLRNVLFFSDDARLVRRVFQSAFGFVERVTVRQLTFVPDQRVWEMIR
jgi:hypothetical protein